MTSDSTLNVKPLSYTLTLIGYMTLTLSLPLVGTISNSLHLGQAHVRFGLTFLFFMFSVSAISLASLSDVFGAKRILMPAQIISISGLIVVSGSTSIIQLYIGLALMGAGTGCYSSIARSLISRHATSPLQLKKSFAILSATIAAGSMLSTYLGRIISMITSWHFAYLSMAIIEIIFMFYAKIILNQDSKTHTLTPLKKIFSNFKHPLSNPAYLINTVIGTSIFAIYLQSLMGNVTDLFIDHFHWTHTQFEALPFFMTLCYLTGIMCFRHFSHQFSSSQFRITLSLSLVIASLFFSALTSQPLWLAVSILCLCFFIGCAMPLCTGSAMSSITKNHGSAAACITFTVSLTMGAWNLIQAYFPGTIDQYILTNLWVIVALFIIGNITILKSKRLRHL